MVLAERRGRVPGRELGVERRLALQRAGVEALGPIGRLRGGGARGPRALYLAGRTWGVPGVPPRQAEAYFKRARVVAPLPEADNAAPLYREAYRLIFGHAYPTWVQGPLPWAAAAQVLDLESFDPPRADVRAWLEQLEPALAKLREGARRPACRYIDLRTATELDRTDEFPIDILILPLAVSARVRLARGDLDGAWVDAETLARLARRVFVHVPLFRRDGRTRGGRPAPAVGGRPSPDGRHAREGRPGPGRRSPRAPRPPTGSALNAALYHNTLDLPREKLIDLFLYGQADLKRKVTAAEKLQYDIQTTPWEVARARKAFDLLAAARIQRFETDPYPFVPHQQGLRAEQWPGFNSMVDPNWGFLVQEDSRTVWLSPADLNALTFTTPLLQYTSMARNSMQWGRGQTMHRAIWLTLLLRLHQARHEGKLPGSLDEILARSDENSGLAAAPEEVSDPYSGKRFGYVASYGQMLLPIGATQALYWDHGRRPDTVLKPAVGYRLLYSVGPNGVNDRAERNVGLDQKGDFVFPLKDDVKPPGIERH